MSISFLTDFLEISLKIDKDDDIHREEKNYYQMLAILPTIKEKYEKGIISELRFNKWMECFKELEGKYG